VNNSNRRYAMQQRYTHINCQHKERNQKKKKNKKRKEKEKEWFVATRRLKLIDKSTRRCGPAAELVIKETARIPNARDRPDKWTRTARFQRTVLIRRIPRAVDPISNNKPVAPVLIIQRRPLQFSSSSSSSSSSSVHSIPFTSNFRQRDRPVSFCRGARGRAATSASILRAPRGQKIIHH
jgi:hypothetical protein